MVCGIKEACFIFHKECIHAFLCVYCFVFLISVSTSFLPWCFSCHFMTECLKVWLSAFSRLGHLTWLMWSSLDGEWVGEYELAHVGTCMWLCPVGLACLDLIGLHLIHPHHPTRPAVAVNRLAVGGAMHTLISWGGEVGGKSVNTAFIWGHTGIKIMICWHLFSPNFSAANAPF